MNDKILLVDDEPMVLKALRRSLGRRYTITCAGSGPEALALSDSEGPFAAVVSDMRMPGMDGLELMREMRRRSPQTVRIILSGHGDFSAVVQAVNKGAVFRFHTKPTPAEVLSASIDSAILRHETEKRLPGQLDPTEELVRDVTELRSAIAKGELRLYVQPQGRLTDGGVTGVEALVRWAHPRKGLLMPGDFLGAAEVAGLMTDITTWMLDAACAELAHWSGAGLQQLHMAVNVTAMDMAEPDAGLLRRVKDAVCRHAVVPERLELELTESSAVADMEGAHATVDELARFGVSLSIDDFGSGYSSLRWLRQLPVRKLKIDRMFIQDIATDPEAYGLLQSIVSLARDLRLVVVAEGAETEGQMEMLRRTRCDLVQGFRFAPPMPAADFLAWLSSHHAGITAQG